MNSTFNKIVELHHELNRIRNIDRCTFFGRLEILEYYCEKTHAAAGQRWRKFGRYGNILCAVPFKEALQLLHTEAKFTIEEVSELYRWFCGQNKAYCNPDEVVAQVYMEINLVQEIWGKPLIKTEENS